MPELPLTSEQISSWQNQGIILLKSVLSPEEVTSFHNDVDKFLDFYEKNTLKDSVASTAHAHGKDYFHVLNLIFHNDKFDKLIDYGKIFNIVTYLAGPYVQLMGLDLFIRKPTTVLNDICKFHTDGGPSLQKILPTDYNLPLQFKVQYFLTDMHQDDMSNFIYIPGSHKVKVEYNHQFCVVPECNKYIEKGQLPPDAVQLKVKAGDVLIHPWSLWHCISANKSDITRKSISVRYGQMWLRPNFSQVPREVLNRLTLRQRRLLGDFGQEAATADFYRPPLDQIKLMLGDNVELYGWN